MFNLRFQSLLLLTIIAAHFIFPCGAAAQNARRRARMSATRPRAATSASTAAASSSGQDGAREYESGTVTINIDVRTNRNTTVRVGMAPHSATLIEFPSNDPVYAVHAGDENFVTVDKKSQNPYDALVFRPGTQFVVPNAKDKPVPGAVITVQRTSGLVTSFVIYPVSRVEDNANRVSITYDRDEVVAARLKVGLSANLDKKQNATATTLALDASDTTTLAPSSPSVGASVSPANKPMLMPAVLTSPAQAANRAASSSSNASAAPVDSPQMIVPPIELLRVVQAEIDSMTKHPPKSLRFAAPVHGLMIGAARGRYAVTGYRIEAIVIRNVLAEPVRLVPNQPDIFVETIGDGKPVQAERLVLRALATTVAADMILLPGKTYFIVTAFDEPILGASQILRAQIAQTNAADEPASVSLVTSAR